ncbi:hypothetical protein LCGC14_0970590 [marine sediment metagenome]|uniref:Uncharacterized protein n=1 Tax=marine sediment metagenome TaxID=412755 RepID=A0A0F9NGA9_9ZZZZ
MFSKQGNAIKANSDTDEDIVYTSIDPQNARMAEDEDVYNYLREEANWAGKTVIGNTKTDFGSILLSCEQGCYWVYRTVVLLKVRNILM